MVVSYAIAMSMNWEKPFWAGLSVAFCSMATAGDSIRKGVLRVVGTFLAGIIAIIMIAAFPQDRWAFLIVMTLFLATCTYRLSSGSRFSDIWFNAGFNLPLLAMLGEGLALNSFEMIQLRILETGLGVVVYSLVAVLLWPRRGGDDFKNNVRSVLSSQYGFFAAAMPSKVNTQPPDTNKAPLRVQLAASHTKLGTQLEGVIFDNEQIMQSRYDWRRCIGQITTLTETLDRWDVARKHLQGVDLQRLLTGTDHIQSEYRARYQAMVAFLTGEPLEYQPSDFDLSVDNDEEAPLSQLQRASLTEVRNQLAEIDRLSQGLFNTFRGIYGQPNGPPSGRQAERRPFAMLDPDRLAAAVRQTSTLWILIVMVLYVPAFPNPIGTLVMGNAFAMVLGSVPFVPARVLFWPVIVGAMFSGAIYIFIMPQLHGFGELGMLLFASTFLIGYVFHEPKNALAKGMGLLTLIIVIGAENEQHFTFLYFANWLFGLAAFVLTLMAAWRFPISFRAEDRFPALLARFLLSAKCLLKTVPGRGSPWQRWLVAFHLQEITVLPWRLRVWSGFLPASALGDTTKPQLDSLLTELLTLSDLIQKLHTIQSGKLSDAQRNALRDIQFWHESVRHIFSHLSKMPASLNEKDSERFESALKGICQHTENVLDQIEENALSAEERRHVYQVLGVYRAVSSAIVELTRRIRPIDWVCLSEVRF